MAGFLTLPSIESKAQKPLTYFDRAAYTSCREAGAMSIETRSTLMSFLIQHAAQMRGVAVPNDERRAQIEALVHSGCTLSPEAHLYTVVDRAILTESGKLPKRQSR